MAPAAGEVTESTIETTGDTMFAVAKAASVVMIIFGTGEEPEAIDSDIVVTDITSIGVETEAVAIAAFVIIFMFGEAIPV